MELRLFRLQFCERIYVVEFRFLTLSLRKGNDKNSLNISFVAIPLHVKFTIIS